MDMAKTLSKVFCHVFLHIKHIYLFSGVSSSCVLIFAVYPFTGKKSI